MLNEAIRSRHVVPGRETWELGPDGTLQFSSPKVVHGGFICIAHKPDKVSHLRLYMGLWLDLGSLAHILQSIPDLFKDHGLRPSIIHNVMNGPHHVSLALGRVIDNSIPS